MYKLIFYSTLKTDWFQCTEYKLLVELQKQIWIGNYGAKPKKLFSTFIMNMYQTMRKENTHFIYTAKKASLVVI